MPTAERLPFLEGIRGLLATYVVIGHLFTMADPSAIAGKPSPAPPEFLIWAHIFGFGHLAVAGFILISGYCLQLALYVGSQGQLRRVGAFYARRARRILPAYYACLAVSLAVAFTVGVRMPGMPFDLYRPVTPENTLAHVLLIHNWRPDWMYRINGVLWTIAIEGQLYVIFPLLALILARFGRWGLLISTIGASVAILAMAPAAMKLYPWYIALFGLGMFSASAVFRPSRHRELSPWLPVLAIALGLGWMLFSCQNDYPIPLRDIGSGLLVAGLAVSLTRRPWSRAARVLGSKPLYVLGTFSYSLYLMHHPIQQVWYFYRPAWAATEWTRLGYLALGLPVIYGLSWLFARYFEVPFVRGRSETAQEPVREFAPVGLPLQSSV